MELKLEQNLYELFVKEKQLKQEKLELLKAFCQKLYKEVQEINENGFFDIDEQDNSSINSLNISSDEDNRYNNVRVSKVFVNEDGEIAISGYNDNEEYYDGVAIEHFEHSAVNNLIDYIVVHYNIF